MAAVFMLFLLISAVTAASAAQLRTSNISLGSSLTPNTNSAWFSPSRIFAFGFYQLPNGYAICIFFASFSDKTVVWTANTDNPVVPSDVALLLTNDGRLILQKRESKDIFSIIVNASQPIAWASMHDNGNFVLYNSNDRVIWQSFDHPTDTLLPGQRLSPGQEIISKASKTDFARGIFRLTMQNDGNLVAYPVDTPNTATNSYFSTGTNGAGNNVSLNFENGGHVYLSNGSSVLLDITRGGYPVSGTIYLGRIDVDGIPRLYTRSLDREGNWKSIWSPTEDKCVPKGVCGFNSFCSYQNQTVNCTCLPGYVFVRSGNWAAGCTRSFTAEVCADNQSANSLVKYEIRRISTVIWEDNFYAILNKKTEQQCQQACLDDCDCDAAFFKDRKCQQQKLPLKYGRRLPSDPTIALVKVIIPAPATTGASKNSGSKNGLSDRQKYVMIGVLLGIAGLVTSSIIVYYAKCRLRNQGKESNQNVDQFLLNQGSLAPNKYSYKEIRKITKSFADKLGQGGYGIVYKGNLPNGQPVAVKVLTETHDNAEEFINEVASISRTSHVNIVNLLGFCYDRKKRALVYEFMPNKSLDKFIYKSGSGDPECSLEWDKLYEIAIGVARGLEYLHRGCSTRIVHFDIKPQNILLDDDFCPKISDFGLAKLFKKKQSIISILGTRGTIGYIAPEVFSRNFGAVSHKSDVYSYGMMLLEMAEAEKLETEATQSSENYFLDKIYGHVLLKNKKLSDLITEEKEETRRKMLLVGLWCIQTAPSDRPSMTKVVEMFEGTLQSIQIPPKPCFTSPNLLAPQFSSSFYVDVETENFIEG